MCKKFTSRNCTYSFSQINKQFFFGVIYYFLVENDEEQ